MTCCIVVTNRDAPTASLPPFGHPPSGEATAQPQQPASMPEQDVPVPMHAAAGAAPLGQAATTASRA